MSKVLHGFGASWPFKSTLDRLCERWLYDKVRRRVGSRSSYKSKQRGLCAAYLFKINWPVQHYSLVKCTLTMHVDDHKQRNNSRVLLLVTYLFAVSHYFD